MVDLLALSARYVVAMILLLLASSAQAVETTDIQYDLSGSISEPVLAATPHAFPVFGTITLRFVDPIENGSPDVSALVSLLTLSTRTPLRPS